MASFLSHAPPLEKILMETGSIVFAWWKKITSLAEGVNCALEGRDRSEMKSEVLLALLVECFLRDRASGDVISSSLKTKGQRREETRRSEREHHRYVNHPAQRWRSSRPVARLWPPHFNTRVRRSPQTHRTICFAWRETHFFINIYCDQRISWGKGDGQEVASNRIAIRRPVKPGGSSHLATVTVMKGGIYIYI